METKAEERNAGTVVLTNSEKEPKSHENQERDVEPCNLAFLVYCYNLIQAVAIHITNWRGWNM